ncbi:nitroreductase family protein [Bergeyella sp. RCAD1439]|uniref:nitroreductase family protein n=1 Tax=Bergeyella anatis TaxID=3113737 RepID=UPI002E18F695|nr:nitroreductase [Bergeyella sp. RCAD1439]
MEEKEVLKSLIERRRSRFPKDYSGAEVASEVLAAVLASAEFAPNHKRTKPWRFRVFQGEEKNRFGHRVAQVYKATTGAEQFMVKKYDAIVQKWERSGAVLTVVVNFSGMVPEWEEVAAVAMAVQNMYLTCEAHGIGCYWATPGGKDHLAEDLGLEANQKCLGFFFMGPLV